MGTPGHRFVVLVVVALLLALGIWVPASADEFIRKPASENTAPKSDNFGHYYCFGPGLVNDPTFTAVAHWAMQSLDNQTNYTAYYSTNCGSPTRDVHWELGALDPPPGSPPGTVRYGVEFCDGVFNGREECERAIVYMNPFTIPNNDSARRKVACHELGHTTGLTHNSIDCMNADPVAAVSDTYHSHHINHINGSHLHPIGHLDSATRITGGIRVTGWALDPDTRYSPYARIEIWVDVTPYPQFNAAGWRADIAAEYPFWWGYHGFSRDVTVGPGPNNVCAYAVNTADSGNNAFIGCIVVP